MPRKLPWWAEEGVAELAAEVGRLRANAAVAVPGLAVAECALLDRHRAMHHEDHARERRQSHAGRVAHHRKEPFARARIVNRVALLELDAIEVGVP